MKKSLLDFKLPTGATGNLANVGDLLKLVLGSAVLLFTFGLGQKLYRAADTKVAMVDASISDPISRPAGASDFSY